MTCLPLTAGSGARLVHHLSVASSIVSPWVATLGNSGTKTLKPPSGSGCKTISHSRPLKLTRL